MRFRARNLACAPFPRAGHRCLRTVKKSPWCMCQAGCLCDALFVLCSCNRVPFAEKDMGAVCVGEHRIVSVFQPLFCGILHRPAAVKAGVVDIFSATSPLSVGRRWCLSVNWCVALRSLCAISSRQCAMPQWPAGCDIVQFVHCIEHTKHNGSGQNGECISAQSVCSTTLCFISASVPPVAVRAMI